MTAGLDAETLDMVLDAIGMFAEGELPDARLLELDAADEFPEEIVRGMCGEQLGISLLFIPGDQPPQPAPRLRWTIHHPWRRRYRRTAGWTIRCARRPLTDGEREI